jgi:hypothetical protein
MRLDEIGKKTSKVLAKPVARTGWDILLKKCPYDENIEEYYEVYFNGKPVGDITNQSDNPDRPNFAVIHYDTDLSWDFIDMLDDAYELVKDTHREYKGGKLKESTALSQQYGGKRAKVLSYSQAVRWLAKDMGLDDPSGIFTISVIYGRDPKEVKRDIQNVLNAMAANR